MRLPSTKKGISMIEIVISAGIVTITVAAIVTVIQTYLSLVKQNSIETQAVLLLDETAEALQYLRDVSFEDNFGDVNTQTAYTIFWNGSSYEMTNETIILPHEMTRKIYFTEVKRNSNDVISQNGTTDERTIKATIVINWPSKEEQKEISSEMLIHDLYEN